jgi:ketosteroid isomerase-like protein
MGLLMRSHLCTALTTLVCFVAACSTEAVAPPPKPPIGSLAPVSVADAGADTVSAKERALADAYAEALSSPPAGSGAPFARLAPLINPDLAEFWSPGTTPAHEPAGIIAAHQALFGAFDDRRMSLGRVWRTPNEQSIEWVMTGKHAREWMGVPATQKRVAFRGLTLLWTKDDGTIVDVHVYFDVGLLKAQLGGSGPKQLVELPAPTPPAGPVRVYEETQAGSAGEQANVAVVRSWLGALENNKESEYLAPLADDAEVFTLQSASPMRGKEDARRYFKAVHKAIGQLDTTVKNAWGVGDFAIVEYDIDGEQLGAFSWIPLLASLPPRTTQVAHFDLVDVCEIRDGKIAHVWRYDNPVSVLRGSAASSTTDAGIPR